MVILIKKIKGNIMKISIFKYVGVFIIFMFCLAPLGAIDLNQYNNTKYTDLEDNETVITVEDANITDDNETEDIIVDESIDDETNKADGTNAVNETDNLKNYYPYDYFEVHVDDIYEGEDAVVEVFTDDFISTGCWVTCHGKSTFLWVDKGYASTTISGLPAGTYKVDLVVQESPNTNTTTFTVKPKKDPLKSLKVNDINTRGDDIVAEISTDEDYTGEVSVKLDNSSDVKTVNIEKGYGKAVFKQDLKKGQHTVEATASPVTIFKKSQMTTNFTAKNIHIISAFAYDIPKNGVLQVFARTDSQYSGEINCYLPDGQVQKEYVENGELATFTFRDTTKLKTGSNAAIVSVLGDDEYFNSNQTSVLFNVK